MVLSPSCWAARPQPHIRDVCAVIPATAAKGKELTRHTETKPAQERVCPWHIPVVQNKAGRHTRSFPAHHTAEHSPWLILMLVWGKAWAAGRAAASRAAARRAHRARPLPMAGAPGTAPGVPSGLGVPLGSGSRRARGPAGLGVLQGSGVPSGVGVPPGSGSPGGPSGGAGLSGAGVALGLCPAGFGAGGADIGADIGAVLPPPPSAGPSAARSPPPAPLSASPRLPQPAPAEPSEDRTRPDRTGPGSVRCSHSAAVTAGAAGQ